LIDCSNQDIISVLVFPSSAAEHQTNASISYESCSISKIERHLGHGRRQG
jgi:hypothetical protein